MLASPCDLLFTLAHEIHIHVLGVKAQKVLAVQPNLRKVLRGLGGFKFSSHPRIISAEVGRLARLVFLSEPKTWLEIDLHHTSCRSGGV